MTGTRPGHTISGLLEVGPAIARFFFFPSFFSLLVLGASVRFVLVDDPAKKVPLQKQRLVWHGFIGQGAPAPTGKAAVGPASNEFKAEARLWYS